MQLSSRFSDSTIATASSSSLHTRLSFSTSCSSLDSDLDIPFPTSNPKPPPRTSSITLASTKSYRKPAPLQLASSHKQRCLTEGEEEDYFSCKTHPGCSSAFHARRCFCGVPVREREGTGREIYCSKQCARRDALYALEGGSPGCTSEEDEEDDEFPVTPTNVFVPSPPRSPEGKKRREETMTEGTKGMGASHYRRMEAMGWYDVDTPTRTCRSGSLDSPIDLRVAQSKKHETTMENRRKTVWLNVPIYMVSPP